jgi:hypothetical protein
MPLGTLTISIVVMVVALGVVSMTVVTEASTQSPRMLKDRYSSTFGSYSSQLQTNLVTLNQHSNNNITNNMSNNNHNGVNLSENDNSNNTKQISGLTFTAKFECGAITEGEGPLGPGYYDTAIGIFNRQDYSPVTILLNTIVNNGKPVTNSVIKTIEPQKTTELSCKDILELLNTRINNAGMKLVEGFVVILVQSNNGLLGSSFSGNSVFTTAANTLSTDQIHSLLDVRVFYSVNSFATSEPNNLLVNKISFSILNDTSGKIPVTMLSKPLYITIQLSSSQVNRISDPESQIKAVLADKYNLSGSEISSLKIRVMGLNPGAGTMLDRHAIFSLQIQPQVIY